MMARPEASILAVNVHLAGPTPPEDVPLETSGGARHRTLPAVSCAEFAAISDRCPSRHGQWRKAALPAGGRQMECPRRVDRGPVEERMLCCASTGGSGFP
jgi:hypothetical protein